MKAFVLAAGAGTRLAPYTDTVPKCLMPIHDRPLLAIWLKLLARAGVCAVQINTHHLAEAVTSWVRQAGRHTAMGLETTHEPRLLGSAGTLWANRHWVDGEKDFLIIYADNLTDMDLAAMVQFHRNCAGKDTLATIGVIRASEPRACGIVEINPTGQVVSFVEKPREPKSDLAFAGICVADPKIFDRFPPPPAQGPFDLGKHVFPGLVGFLSGYRIPGYLRDIGTLDAYHRALSEWPPNQREP
jgi:mannose-1-phosphate guanylyltransferase